MSACNERLCRQQGPVLPFHQHVADTQRPTTHSRRSNSLLSSAHLIPPHPKAHMAGIQPDCLPYPACQALRIDILVLQCLPCGRRFSWPAHTRQYPRQVHSGTRQRRVAAFSAEKLVRDRACAAVESEREAASEEHAVTMSTTTPTFDT